jgi:hypothetical protein
MISKIKHPGLFFKSFSDRGNSCISLSPGGGGSGASGLPRQSEWSGFKAALAAASFLAIWDQYLILVIDETPK